MVSKHSLPGLFLLVGLYLVPVPGLSENAGPPVQYPFACTAQDYGLELVVDNQEGVGVAVHDPDGKVKGYSRDCRAGTRTWYYAVDTDGERHRVRDQDEGPLGGEGMEAIEERMDGACLANTELTDGREVAYLIRHERGVINRFIYSISMLVPPEEITAGRPEAPSHDNWNGRLLFQFQGGVGIGHTQGRFSHRGITGRPDRLARGYAVAFSTANRTGDHYNTLVGGRTAVELKEHFIDSHGEPDYTVGLGGSGGAVQHYLYAQNHPGLLDAAVPQRSYPDMATQAIHVSDCSLLDYWMEREASDPDFWADWDNRQLLQGFNSIEGYMGRNARRMVRLSRIVGLFGAELRRPTGSSECMEGWLGLLPLAFNPHFGSEANWDLLEDQVDDIERTHFSDAREAYGTDPETGLARRPWDNTGVQYGLRAMVAGEITPEQFLEVNHEVGGWKPTKRMRPELLPFTYPGDLITTLAEDRDWPRWRVVVELITGGLAWEELFDPWGGRNQWSAPDETTAARRTQADVAAITGAIESGLVFAGKLDRQIPIIDVRDYLERVLDMHNARQSFVARARLEAGQGHAATHRVWFADADEDGVSPQIEEISHQALDAIALWMEKLAGRDDGDVAAAAPEVADDACFSADGSVIATGSGVWDGIIDDRPEGECTREFPLHSTSRLEAGGPFTDDVFKCHTMSVESAIAEGLYGEWTPSEAQFEHLEAIFPDGVCDYGLPGVGDPRADVPGSVTVEIDNRRLVVTGARPGAEILVRKDGREIERTRADGDGRAVFDGLEGTFVVAQSVDGQRGMLTRPVELRP